MRNIVPLLTLSAALLNTGCSSLLSITPVAGQQNSTSVPGLTGLWAEKGEKGEKELYSVRETGAGIYEIRVDSERFEARAFKIEDANYLDLRPLDEHPLQLPAHAIVRFWLEGDTLRWAFVDSDWIKALVASSNLPAATLDKTILITHDTGQLRDMLSRPGAADSAYSNTTTLARLR